MKLSVLTSKDKSWASKGFEVACQQFKLPFFKEITEGDVSVKNKKLSVKNGDNLIVENEDLQLEVDKKTGWIVSYQYKGRNLISSPVKPNFWRPLTDNDSRGWNVYEKCAFWKDAPDKLNLESFELVGFDSDKKEIKVKKSVPGKIEMEFTYTIYGSGDLKIDYKLDCDSTVSQLLRVGMQFETPDSYDDMDFYGKGPWENYSDRFQGAFVGEYSGKVTDFVWNYIMPQENGNHTAVRWIKLNDESGTGILITGKQPLSVSVWPWSMENIESAKHICDLKAQPNLTVNIDLVQTGVGGIDSWSNNAAPLEKYRIEPGKYQYSFMLQPVTKKSNVDLLNRNAIILMKSE